MMNRFVGHFDLGKRVTFSIIDQGLYSGSNLICQILFVRFLGLEQYGVLALALSVLVFADAILRPVLTEPVLVIGTKFRNSALGKYLSLVLIAYLVSALFVSALFVAAFFVLRYAGRDWNILCYLAIVYPAIGSYWLLRLGCYLSQRPDISATCSAIYAAVLFSAVLGLGVSGALSTENALLALGGSAFVSSVICGVCLKIRIALLSRRSCRMLLLVLYHHWIYGRWMLIGSLGYWITNTGFIPLTGILISVDAAGAMRAIQNLFQPLSQVCSAIYNLILPIASRRFRQDGRRALLKTVTRVLFSFAAISLLYVLVVVAFGTFIIDVIYREKSIAAYTYLIYFFAVLFILNSLKQSLVLNLAAARETGRILIGRMAGVAATAATAWPLTAHFGAGGMISSMVLAELAMVFVAIVFVIRALRGPETGQINAA